MKNINFHTDSILRILRKHHVGRLNVVGSFARDEDTSQSDIDLLATFLQPISLLELVALERELSEALGREVDLLTENGLSPYLRSQILSDRHLVYEA